MNTHVGPKPSATLHNAGRAWLEVPAQENGDAIVAALVAGDVDYLFFTSGSEIGFYQEAIAKLIAQGRKAPKLITVTHEHANLNAALGYAAVSGKPAVTAAHVDCGTQHYSGAIHTAWHSGLPVLITAGAPPVAYPGSMRGARDGGGHIWVQQTFDQNGIVRQYTKWDHRMEMQDNPGLMVSRALQVARTEPCGPVYLSLPREVSLAKVDGARFPTLSQLGLPALPAPHPDAIRDLAQRLVEAENPYVVVAKSGRNLATVPALVKLCETLALPACNAALRAFLSFPMDHPLWHGNFNLKDADCVLVLDVDIPWMPGEDGPPDHAFVCMVDLDPAKRRVPTMEFTADMRIMADSLLTIEALQREVDALLTDADRTRLATRTKRHAATSAARRKRFADEAVAVKDQTPCDVRWLNHCIGKVVDDNAIVFDETIVRPNALFNSLSCSRPGSFFYNPGSSGGWATGAALGGKLAAPDRDVIAISGDGFYMFGTPIHALWSAKHYNAPFLQIVYQNRSYSTGTSRVHNVYGDDGYAAKGGYEGGYFDPPIDFAKEAEAAGCYGETVRDPGDVEAALRRGLAKTREGQPAVISVWLPRLLQKD